MVPTEDDSEKLLAAKVLDKVGASLTLMAVTVNSFDVVLTPSEAFTVMLYACLVSKSNKLPMVTVPLLAMANLPLSVPDKDQLIVLASESLADEVAMVVPTAELSTKLLAANVLDKEGASLTLVAEIDSPCEVVWVPSDAFTVMLYACLTS